MKSLDDLKFNSTRRHFLSAPSLGIRRRRTGRAARPPARARGTAGSAVPAAQGGPLFVGATLRAARQARDLPVPSGGPSQLELFDYKADPSQMNGQELPASVRWDSG
jgi:hypothetical protein